MTAAEQMYSYSQSQQGIPIRPKAKDRDER